MTSIPSSAQLYTAKIEDIRKLVFIAQRVPTLDSLVELQDKEIKRMEKIIKADSIILMDRTNMILAIGKERDDYKGLYETQLVLTKLEKKEKRNWRFKAILSLAVASGVFILSLNQ